MRNALILLALIGGCGRIGFTSSQALGGGDGGGVVIEHTISAQTAYLKASNTGANDSFGSSLALSADGTTLAVGANDESSAATGINGNQASNAAAQAGAIYVFTNAGTTWSQEAYIKASNTDANDWFGGSVALSADGNTLAVGAYSESSAATGINGNQASNAAAQAGAVYVFTRSGTTWTQQAYIKASNTGADDAFGSSVALSGDGNILAVAAVLEASAGAGVGGNQADNSAVGAGAVYMYTRSGTAWSQEAYIKASNPNADDFFGAAIALSTDGTTLAVGANGESSAATGIGGNQSDNGAIAAGAAYVFVRTGTTWAQQAYLKASNADAYDNLGTSLALSASGDTLAVASIGESSGAAGIDGNGLDNTSYQSGAVYMFVRAGTSWSQQAYVKASNPGLADEFGNRVALSADGSVLAASAVAESSAATGIGGNQADDSKSSSGAAYVFGRAGTRWSQLAYVKASNTDAGDGFGTDLALSADAGILSVSALGESSTATGVNGNQASNAAQFSGAAYVFR